MSLRGIIIIAIYRLLSLRDFRSSPDPFLDRVLPIAWTQGEQAYSFATAIIPSLMPFLMKLNTGLGALSREDFVKETTRQESSGGGNGARVDCSRCTSRRYLGYLDQWSMFPRCESEFQSEPFKDDLSLKLVVFRQVPPPLASFSVSTLRHMVISRRWFP